MKNKKEYDVIYYNSDDDDDKDFITKAIDKINVKDINDVKNKKYKKTKMLIDISEEEADEESSNNNKNSNSFNEMDYIFDEVDNSPNSDSKPKKRKYNKQNDKKDFNVKEVVQLKDVIGPRPFLTSNKTIIIKSNQKCKNEEEVTQGMKKIMVALNNGPEGMDVEVLGISLPEPFVYVSYWLYNRKINSLSFSMCNLTTFDVEGIRRFIKLCVNENIQKKKFAIVGNNFSHPNNNNNNNNCKEDNNCVAELCKIIQYGIFIENIDLSSNHIDDDGFKRILDSGMNRKNLISLDLSDNDLEITSFFDLLEFLTNFKQEPSLPIIIIKDNFKFDSLMLTGKEIFSKYLFCLLGYIVKDEVHLHVTFFSVMKQFMKMKNFLSFYSIESFVHIFFKPRISNIVQFRMESYRDFCNLDDEVNDGKYLVAFHQKFNYYHLTPKTKSILIRHAIDPHELKSNILLYLKTLGNPTLKKISLFYD